MLFEYIIPTAKSVIVDKIKYEDVYIPNTCVIINKIPNVILLFLVLAVNSLMKKIIPKILIIAEIGKEKLNMREKLFMNDKFVTNSIVDIIVR